MNPTEQLTPMMRQYHELKQQAGDAILFFRMGDFYEIFGDDAELVAPLLEIVLTSRERGDQTKIPFCGVPHHSARLYWLKLLKSGFKIALADQVEDPKLSKGLVKREITRFMTPACTDDIEALDRERPNYLAAAYELPESKRWAFCLADISTGELRLALSKDAAELHLWIERYRPKEVLVRKFHIEDFKASYARAIQEREIAFSALSEAALRDETMQQQVLTAALNVASVNGLPCGKVEGGDAVVAALFMHLNSLKQTTGQFSSVVGLVASGSMRLDDIAIRDLELFETLRRRQSEGSLFREINQCLTPMGCRRLREWMTHPLADDQEISARQDVVERFNQNADFVQDLRQLMLRVHDLDRLITRLLGKNIQPSELVQIRIGLECAKALSLKLVDLNGPRELQKIGQLIGQPTNALTLLQRSLLDQPGQLGQGDGVFKASFDARLGDLIGLVRNSEELIASYEQKLRDDTKINSLKVRMHKTFGLVIEVTKSHLSKVPGYFVRRQTMVNNERFATPELAALSEKILSAQEDLIAHEQVLYSNLLEAVAAERKVLQQIAYGLSLLDVFQSFSWKAMLDHYVRPSLSRNQTLSLKKSRHPVVERFVGVGKFAANDLVMKPSAKQILITGPNMGGKSTMMRQVALIAIMHQTGMFVPAAAAELPVFDAVYTRVGAADDLAKGQSTFLVEMIETANILRSATCDSLVILDEVGRGTSTEDGLAIATAVLEELVSNVKCYCLFATHFHEIAGQCKALPTLVPMQTEVRKDRDGIYFTHRLIDGSTNNSYGIEVAKLAGLPNKIISRANLLLRAPSPTLTPSAQSNPEGFFSSEASSTEASAGIENNRLKALSDRLEQIKLNRTTPLQALNILSDLKDMLANQVQPGLFDG